MTLRELVTKWGFEVDHAPLNKMESQLEAIKHRLDLLTGIEIVRALAGMAERFSQFGEALHIAAESAGLTVEEFQKLAFSAAQSSISQEELETSLFRLSRRLNDAKHGSGEAQKAFAQLGITGDQIHGFHTSRDALYAISDRMAKIKDPIEKAALAQELLGRGSKHMVGYLSQGSAALKAQGDEAEKLGLILSEGQVEALTKLEHALQKFWALLKNIGAVIAADIAPVFEYLINDFIKFFGANREIIQQNIEKTLENIAYAMGFLWEITKLLIGDFIKFAKIFGIEDKILPMLVAFASFVASIALVKKTISGVISVVTLLTETFGVIMKVVTFVEEAFIFLEGIISLPFILGLAAVVALIFVLHEFWALLTGKPTWLGQFYEWIKSLDIIKAALSFISDTWDSIKGGIGGAVSAAGRLLGITGDNNSPGALNQFGALASNGPNVSNVQAPGGNYSVNAPIEVHVPPGTNPDEVGKHVQVGVKDHLDRVYRETQRSTLNPVAY